MCLFHLVWVYCQRATHRSSSAIFQAVPASHCTVLGGSAPCTRIPHVKTCVTAETSCVLIAILHNPDFKLKRWKWKDLDRGSQNIIIGRDTKHHWVQGSHSFLPQVSCQPALCPGFARKNVVTIQWFGHRHGMRSDICHISASLQKGRGVIWVKEGQDSSWK